VSPIAELRETLCSAPCMRRSLLPDLLSRRTLSDIQRDLSAHCTVDCMSAERPKLVLVSLRSLDEDTLGLEEVRLFYATLLALEYRGHWVRLTHMPTMLFVMMYVWKLQPLKWLHAPVPSAEAVVCLDC
jgi:hypothetical protein